MSIEPHAPSPEPPLWARGVCDGVYRAGIRDVVYVPDNPLSHVLREFESRYAAVRLTLATREEEAFGVAAGLYLGGRPAGVLLQSSGLGNSLNAVTSLLIPYEIPVFMIVSMRGDEGEWNAAQMPMGRAIRGILDAIHIPHVTVDAPERTGDIVHQAAMRALSSRTTGACLLPRRVTSGITGSDPQVNRIPGLTP